MRRASIILLVVCVVVIAAVYHRESSRLHRLTLNPSSADSSATTAKVLVSSDTLLYWIVDSLAFAKPEREPEKSDVLNIPVRLLDDSLLHRYRSKHPLASLLAKTAVSPQFFHIRPQYTNILTTAKSTKLVVPPRCFVNSLGDVVTGDVTLEIREAITPYELLFSALTTTVSTSILETQGMLYVNAFETRTRQPLQIIDNQSIYIEMPCVARNGESWLFYGFSEPQGNLSWVMHTPQIQTVIPFSLSALPLDSLGLPPDISVAAQKTQYENTAIASREFCTRLAYIADKKETIGTYLSPIVQIYFNGYDTPLYELDYRVYLYMSKILQEAQSHSKKMPPNWAAIANHFKFFSDERYQKVQNFAPFGIAIESPNAFKELQWYFGSRKAHEILNIYALKKGLQVQAKQHKNAIQVTANSSSKNTFSLTKTGWANIAHYLGLNKAKQNIYIKIKNASENTGIFLLLNNYDALVPAQRADQTSFVFKNIPIGEPAYLITLSYENQQPYLDVLNIKTGQKVNYDINLRATTFDMLQYELRRLIPR